MDNYVVNALILPLFVTWFIPNTIRDPKTGEYRGFKNKLVLIQLIFLFGFESYLVWNKFGLDTINVLRIAFIVGITFILALLYVKFTQKQLFGNEFKMKVKSQRCS